MDPSTLFGICAASALPPCITGAHADQGILHAAVGPQVDAGFPTFRAGIHGRLTLDGGAPTGVFVQADASLTGAATGLGLPGPRLEGSIALPVGFRVGGFGLSYEPILYLDTQATSQLSGAITLSVERGRYAWLYRFENDYLGSRHRDEWRTAAIETHLFIEHDDLRWGVGVETKVWTATTHGLASLSTGEAYDLSGQHGEGWSHGIACLAVTIESTRLCVGWDSEGIRDSIQNRFHELIDDGALPRLDRSGQPYVRLSFNPSRASY